MMYPLAGQPWLPGLLKRTRGVRGWTYGALPLAFGAAALAWAPPRLLDRNASRRL